MTYQAKGRPFPLEESVQKHKAYNDKIRRWTQPEIDQLLNLFPKTSKTSLEAIFGRPWIQIRQKYKLLTKANIHEVRKGID